MQGLCEFYFCCVDCGGEVCLRITVWYIYSMFILYLSYIYSMLKVGRGKVDDLIV